MPTAAKLFGAVAFALLGWFSAHVFSAALPEGVQIGFLREIVAAIGLISGWRVTGASVGKGYYAAAGAGIKGGITMVFFALLGFSLYEMILLSVRMRYDGPMEAVLGVFDLMLKYGRMMLTTETIGTLFFGSILGGWFAEFGSRHWK